MAQTIGRREVTGRGWRLRHVLEPYLFLLPCLVLFLGFRLYPMLQGLYLGFTNARLGPRPAEFIGLANFNLLLQDARFLRSLENTALYTVASALPVLVLPLVLAVFLARGTPLQTFLRGVFFFPFTLSVVTIGITWVWLLDPVVGPVNYYLTQLGLPAPTWLGSPRTAMTAIIASAAWWVAGFYLVIYLAALQDIPKDLYEAAALDGASGWRSFWSITMPLLRPIFLLVAVLHIVGSFQVFGHVFVISRGGPADATRMVVQHIYETAFSGSYVLGYAAAMSLVLFAIIAVFSLIQFRALRGGAEY